MKIAAIILTLALAGCSHSMVQTEGVCVTERSGLIGITIKSETRCNLPIPRDQ